jgi:hypothetical protein
VALWECVGCSTVFAVGLPACPHCRSTDHYEQGQEPPVAKTTVHMGASNALDPESTAAAVPAAAAPVAAEAPADAPASLAPDEAPAAPQDEPEASAEATLAPAKRAAKRTAPKV